MSTRITNLTAALATLPFPYRGAIAPGRGAIVSDSPAAVLANLGLNAIEGVFRLDLTTEPGQAQYDPAPGSPSVAYDPLPDPTTVGASPTNPVIAVGPSGMVYSNGTEWLNYEGAQT